MFVGIMFSSCEKEGGQGSKATEDFLVGNWQSIEIYTTYTEDGITESDMYDLTSGEYADASEIWEFKTNGELIVDGEYGLTYVIKDNGTKLVFSEDGEPFVTWDIEKISNSKMSLSYSESDGDFSYSETIVFKKL